MLIFKSRFATWKWIRYLEHAVFTYDDIVETVPVEVGGGEAVAEVGADLAPRQVVQVRQVRVVQQHLQQSASLN